MKTIEDYEIRMVNPADENQVEAMAHICAEGRVRAYGIQPGDLDYKLGVTYQLSSDGLKELQHQTEQATAQDAATGFWVAERRADSGLAGICIAQMFDTPPHVYLDRVFVAEADEGNGIASVFLERVITWAKGKPIEGEVVNHNERALGLYMRRGFVVAGPVEPTPGFETGLERVKIVRKGEKSW